MRRVRASVLMLAALSAPALGQENGGAKRVIIERTGYRLTSLGARVSASARVLDTRRRAVPNAPIAWRIADSAVASVSALGVVQSRRVGRTRLWAVSGSDSASALILVDQWVAKFDFTPSRLRFDAVGARLPLRIRVRDAAGNAIADRARRIAGCRSLNERIATLSAQGQVLSRANGVTYVRCTDRGIADSVRVEVRQRAVRAEIVNKLSFGPRMVGDTFQVRLRAFDQTNDEIPDAPATWASLNSSVVSIDPLTGKARSLGMGDTRIIAQVGDVTDTLAITVQASGGGPSLSMTGAMVDPAGLPIIDAARSAHMRLELIFPVVGDTSRIMVTARDATGVLINSAERDIVLRSSNPGVVAVISDNRVVSLRTGSAWIVATLGTLSDSMQVAPRSRNTLAMGASGSSNVRFDRPAYDTAGARIRNRRQLDSARTAILRSSAVVRTRERYVQGSAQAALTMHSARLSSAVSESRSGVLVGGQLAAAPHKQVTMTGDFRLGTLAGDNGIGEDMRVTEFGGDMTWWPAGWFGLRGGYTRRSESTILGRQQWQFVNATAVTRFRFVGGAISTVSAFSILPWGDFSGNLDAANNKVSPNSLSLAGEMGVEAQTRYLSAALMYYVERFTFPEVNGAERRDQFSSLRFRLGMQFGR
jgi:hypothetical protein